MLIQVEHSPSHSVVPTMTIIKLAVFYVLACLGPTHAAPIMTRVSTGTEATDVCFPHLLNPDGSCMTADIKSYYSPKSCLDGILLALLSDSGVGLMEIVQQSGATVYCRGLVQLLSLVEAYGWTDCLCKRPLIDKKQHFCDYSSLSARIAWLNEAVGKLDRMNYKGLSAVATQMLSTLALGKCAETCVGPVGSALCGTFFDVMTFFVEKYGKGESHIIDFQCISALTVEEWICHHSLVVLQCPMQRGCQKRAAFICCHRR